MKRGRILIHAAAVADGDAADFAPGALLVSREDRRILAVGRPEQIGSVVESETIDLPGHVVIPALVNAHAHLDLTHIGPIHPESGAWTLGDFVSWVDVVRRRRAVEPEQIRASVLSGAEKAVTGGTRFVGDIAGASSLAAVDALRESDLEGVSYLEIFGNGSKREAALTLLDGLVDRTARSEHQVRLGVQPHAPYSCAKEVYAKAASLGLPLATHLAETPEELQFIRDAAGPLAELLKRLGVWDERVQPTMKHPIDHLHEVLSQSPFVAAHLNYIEPSHLDLLAEWPITVAYCPRASAYFGHPRPAASVGLSAVEVMKAARQEGRKGGSDSGHSIPSCLPASMPSTTDSRRPIADSHEHPYREMLVRGVNVAIGTDSIICLDTPDRISVIDEMKLLLLRDGTDARTLLRMATINGAIALGIDPREVTFASGSTPGIIALPIADSRLSASGRRSADSPSMLSAAIANFDGGLQRIL
jgi:aminodeoxyfutalosine deaminase